MKKSFSLFLAICMLFVTAMCPAVYAASDRYFDSQVYDSGGGIEITTGGGKQIQLVGHVSPTIISVTMPSRIPFDISAGVTRQNQVVSPEITIENHSAVPVNILVDHTEVDTSKLNGEVEWKTQADVGEKGLAVGLKKSTKEPSTLDNAKWLANGEQNLELLNLGANAKDTLFVVGAIGPSVPQDGTFTVTPTLVVKKA